MNGRTPLAPLSNSERNSRPSLGTRFSNPVESKSRSSILSNGRPSIIPGRKSSIGVGQPRKSSIRPRTSSLSARGDPRDIGDKQFTNDSIRYLVEYLTQHNFDHAISPKILGRPTGKDFSNIMNFLFRQIDSNFICTGKFEDEVITMFKFMKYPYPISKTGLVAVGSPHTWPALLAAINWIIELLYYDEEVTNASKHELESEMDDPSSSEKAFYAYLHESYTNFIQGHDHRFKELEEQFVHSFVSKNDEITEQIRFYERENERIQNDIKVVEEKATRLPSLQSKKKDYERDLEKFQQLIDQLERHHEQLQGKLSSRKAELVKLQEATRATEKDIEHYSRIISSQELSAEDVQRLQEEKSRLQDQLQQAIENRAAMQRKVWETENGLREAVTDLETNSRAHNALIEEMQISGHDSRNERGQFTRLLIDVDTRAKRKSELLRSEVRGEVIPAMLKLKNEISESSSGLRAELLVLQDEAEEVEQRISEVVHEESVQETRLRKAEEAHRREKESMAAAESLQRKEVEELEAKLERLRDASAEEGRTIAAARRTAEAQAALEAGKLEHTRTKRNMIAAIMEVVAQCAEHKERVQKKLGGVKESYRQRLEGLLLGQGLGNRFSVDNASDLRQTSTEGAAASGDVAWQNRLENISGVHLMDGNRESQRVAEHQRIAQESRLSHRGMFSDGLLQRDSLASHLPPQPPNPIEENQTPMKSRSSSKTRRRKSLDESMQSPLSQIRETPSRPLTRSAARRMDENKDSSNASALPQSPMNRTVETDSNNYSTLII